MKIRSVEFAGTVVDPSAHLPGDLPQIAFSGRSNVGKSTLINTLLRRTRKGIAHVSATPGKTQGLNFYRVNERFFLVDLPGFGFARVPDSVRRSWKVLVEGYLARPDGPIAVVHLVDARREPTDTDHRMLEYLGELGTPTLVVVTKTDKLTRSRRATTVASLADGLGLDMEQVISSSSKTGEGRDEILAAIDGMLDLAEAKAAPSGAETPPSDPALPDA